MNRLPIAKNAARVIQAYLKEQNISLKHTQILEIIARDRGYANYNVMKANTVEEVNQINPPQHMDWQEMETERMIKTLRSTPSPTVNAFYEKLLIDYPIYTYPEHKGLCCEIELPKEDSDI